MASRNGGFSLKPVGESARANSGQGGRACVAFRVDQCMPRINLLISSEINNRAPRVPAAKTVISFNLQQ
jgi:hypothetical protein